MVNKLNRQSTTHNNSLKNGRPLDTFLENGRQPLHTIDHSISRSNTKATTKNGKMQAKHQFLPCSKPNKKMHHSLKKRRVEQHPIKPLNETINKPKRPTKTTTKKKNHPSLKWPSRTQPQRKNGWTLDPWIKRGFEFLILEKRTRKELALSKKEK